MLGRLIICETWLELMRMHRVSNENVRFRTGMIKLFDIVEIRFFILFLTWGEWTKGDSCNNGGFIYADISVRTLGGRARHGLKDGMH